VAVLLAIAFAGLLVRAQTRRGVPDADPAWIEQFSLARYRPMERLFRESDYQFLRSQTGYTPTIGRRLRKERRRIHRAYLRDLRSDFRRLHGAAWTAIARSEEDVPELASLLVRQRWIFALLVTRAELSLVLDSLGVRPPDLSTVLGGLEKVRFRTAELSRVSAG
jgi:hypothetical protein